MNNHDFSNYISNLIIKSMLYEVSTTPKPGLVDRSNAGAHKDMDFFTFIDSSVVLKDYFYNCVMAGLEFEGNQYSDLLIKIRPLGIVAEDIMFQATSGINTHKGLVFSFGIIGAAVGSLYRESQSIYFTAEHVSARSASISKGVTIELTSPELNKSSTYGERLYNRYNTTCIRGEVESGFETVMKYSLPILNSLMNEGHYHINDIMVQVLLHLIVHTVDCNILGRHDMEMLIYAQEYAKDLLDDGGYLSVKGRMDIVDMDKDFIQKNISPGGAADLLAITLMLYYLENGSN